MKSSNLYRRKNLKISELISLENNIIILCLTTSNNQHIISNYQTIQSCVFKRMPVGLQLKVVKRDGVKFNLLVTFQNVELKNKSKVNIIIRYMSSRGTTGSIVSNVKCLNDETMIRNHLFNWIDCSTKSQNTLIGGIKLHLFRSYNTIKKISKFKTYVLRSKKSKIL